MSRLPTIQSLLDTCRTQSIARRRATTVALVIPLVEAEGDSTASNERPTMFPEITTTALHGGGPRTVSRHSSPDVASPRSLETLASS